MHDPVQGQERAARGEGRRGGQDHEGRGDPAEADAARMFVEIAEDHGRPRRVTLERDADRIELAAAGGQKFPGGDETQMAYHHGVSLNLPQEYGTRNDSMEGVTHMGIAVWDNLGRKMKKGTGEAFAFGLNKKGNGFDYIDNVDVNAMIKKYEKFYDEVLFNPEAAGRGYDPEAMARYNDQIARDQGKFSITWYPKSFYGHNYGGGVQ